VTTYRLPDGAEIASLDVNGSNIRDRVWVTHPTLGSIMIDREKLTEVPPPLPPVPDAPAVLVGDMVWARDDMQGVGPVFVCPGYSPVTWPELHQIAEGKPIVALVPDPAAGAPELPWEGLDARGGKLTVHRNGSLFRIGGPGLYYSDVRVDVAEQAALAILRAAREARRTQHDTQEG
jgi:hypothetical protein